MRYLFCLVILLALMLRAVPSVAWADHVVKTLAGQPSGDADEDSGDAGESDAESSLEKEPFTKPLIAIQYQDAAVICVARSHYFPLGDSGRHLHHPDIHTPPPDNAA